VVREGRRSSARSEAALRRSERRAAALSPRSAEGSGVTPPASASGEMGGCDVCSCQSRASQLPRGNPSPGSTARRQIERSVPQSVVALTLDGEARQWSHPLPGALTVVCSGLRQRWVFPVCPGAPARGHEPLLSLRVARGALASSRPTGGPVPVPDPACEGGQDILARWRLGLRPGRSHTAVGAIGEGQLGVHLRAPRAVVDDGYQRSAMSSSSSWPRRSCRRPRTAP